MEKYGFVYIWRDCKHKRYYIGSHWGAIDDGYICSSAWMKKAFKRRPKDFKRRILTLTDSRLLLLVEEQRWLSLTKANEIGVKYYNLTQIVKHHWHSDKEKLLNVSQKISKANKGVSRNKGKSPSAETRAKISARLKGKSLGYERSEETRAKISVNSKKLQAEGKIGTKGKHHSEETKIKMSDAQSGANNHMFGKTHTEEVRIKISEASSRRIVSEETRTKISKSNRGNSACGRPGHKASAETIAKRVAKTTGQKRTPEARERMKQSRLAYLAKQKSSS